MNLGVVIVICIFGWIFYKIHSTIVNSKVLDQNNQSAPPPGINLKGKPRSGVIFAIFIIFFIFISINSGTESVKTVNNPWLPKLKSSYINSCHIVFSFSVVSQLQKQGRNLSSADITKVSQNSFNYCGCLTDKIESKNLVDVSSAYFNSTEDNNLAENISKVDRFISSSEGKLISDKCVDYSF